MFLLVVLSIWTLMNAYVFARLWVTPGLSGPAGHRWLIVAAVLLWAAYPLSRYLEHLHWTAVSRPLEFAGAAWMGVVLLALVAFLAVDVVTGFAWLAPRLAPPLRAGALAVTVALSLIALVQGLRPPVVHDIDLTVASLPGGRSDLTLAAVSDLHLGTLLGRRWLASVVDRVDALRPDMVLVVGDLIDGNVARVEPMVPELRRLSAPLGVWAVTGNHEFYAGVERSVALFREAGFTVLRDRWQEAAPGLVMAGVDDLTAREQFGLPDNAVENALAARPQGLTILLSHTPWSVETAASLGADLMLSGHTHDGQIWPFGALVALRYPFLAGRFTQGAMTLLVGRGTGTWGPRMRLWRPSEILRVRLHLRAPAPPAAG